MSKPKFRQTYRLLLLLNAFFYIYSLLLLLLLFILVFIFICIIVLKATASIYIHSYVLFITYFAKKRFAKQRRPQYKQCTKWRCGCHTYTPEYYRPSCLTALMYTPQIIRFTNRPTCIHTTLVCSSLLKCTFLSFCRDGIQKHSSLTVLQTMDCVGT